MWRPIHVWLARCIKLACALLAGGVLYLAGILPAAAEVIAESVTVDHRQGAYFGHLAFDVVASPATVREVLTDFEQMPAFMPNLESSRVLAHEGNVYRIAQRGRASFGPVSYRFESERRIEWFPDGRLVSDAIGGTVRKVHSELIIRPGPLGSHIDYRIEMQPESWFPSALGSAFLRHELAEQFSAMAREMERRQQRAGH